MRYTICGMSRPPPPAGAERPPLPFGNPDTAHSRPPRLFRSYPFQPPMLKSAFGASVLPKSSVVHLRMYRPAVARISIASFAAAGILLMYCCVLLSCVSVSPFISKIFCRQVMRRSSQVMYSPPLFRLRNRGRVRETKRFPNKIRRRGFAPSRKTAVRSLRDCRPTAGVACHTARFKRFHRAGTRLFPPLHYARVIPSVKPSPQSAIPRQLLNPAANLALPLNTFASVLLSM